MGRLAMGRRALGFSSGFAVKVGNDEPGPQRMIACSPGEGAEMAWGIAGARSSGRAGEGGSSWVDVSGVSFDVGMWL